MVNSKDNYEYRILSSIRKIVRAIDIYSRKINSEFGLTTPQLLCLYSLREKESMTLSQLAAEVNLGTSTVNGIVDRLQAKTLINRERALDDKRRVCITITDKGREIVEKSPSLIQDKFANALAVLPEDEQKRIAESIESIVELMSVDNVDASPNLIPSAPI